MGYIIFFILFAPFILYIIGGLFRSTKKTVQNIGDDLFRPEKGRYNLQKINLLDYLNEHKTFIFYIQMRLDNSERYIKLRHLTESSYEIATHTSTYIIIPSNIDWTIKSEFPKTFTDSSIKRKELLDILNFILVRYDIIRYNDYPKDKTTHYTLTPTECSNQTVSNEYLQKLFSTVKNFNDIYYDFNLTERGHHSEFLKLLNQHNWDCTKFKIPTDWQHEFDSKKYRNAIEWFYQLD